MKPQSRHFPSSTLRSLPAPKPSAEAAPSACSHRLAPASQRAARGTARRSCTCAQHSPEISSHLAACRFSPGREGFRPLALPFRCCARQRDGSWIAERLPSCLNLSRYAKPRRDQAAQALRLGAVASSGRPRRPQDRRPPRGFQAYKSHKLTIYIHYFILQTMYTILYCTL